MDSPELTMEEKCENVMNAVVETRKQFGKMCVDYDHKISLMENKMLNLQLETISNYRFICKNPLPRVDVEEMCKDIDNFSAEIVKRKQRIERLKKKIINTQDIVLQLKQDDMNKKIHRPLTAEAMLADAKQKMVQVKTEVKKQET